MENHQEEKKEQQNFTKLAIVTIAGVLILLGAIYAAYRYSQSKTGDIVLPGGVTYLGPSPTPSSQPTSPPLKFTADSTVTYNSKTGANHPYSFAHPSTLPLVVFTRDLSDSVAIDWGGIPPQQNVLFNVELIEKRDPKYLDRPKEEYIRNWFKFFPGLKGMASIQAFTNTNGLRGFKAQYINQANQTPNVDVFFEVPGRKDIMLHLANGILDYTIFDRIVDSVKWNVPSPTPSK